jgi:hypothetical protein
MSSDVDIKPFNLTARPKPRFPYWKASNKTTGI